MFFCTDLSVAKCCQPKRTPYRSLIGPAMFTGAVSVGLLFQVNNAYGQVDGAFSVVLNNWTTLTELRSIWKRLHEFEGNLDKYDIGHDVAADAQEASPLPI